MNNFEKVISFILKVEGGYVDNPNDPGMITKYGISKRQYPDLDIKNLTIEQAKEIYKRDYWDALHLDLLPNCSLQYTLMDTAVNLGKKRATRWLQKGLNYLCSENLKRDGILGPKTLQAIQNNLKYSYRLSDFVLNERMNFYNYLGHRRKWAKEFLYGWLNRIYQLKLVILKGC